MKPVCSSSLKPRAEEADVDEALKLRTKSVPLREMESFDLEIDENFIRDLENDLEYSSQELSNIISMLDRLAMDSLKNGVILDRLEMDSLKREVGEITKIF